MSFRELIETSPYIITEGSLVERLRRDTGIPLDPYILHAGFIYEDNPRDELSQIYRQYMDIGKKYDLPMLTYTPTWRANKEHIEKSPFRQKDINGDACRFLAGLSREYHRYGKKILIGGLMGCKGDAYKPEESLSTKEAASFHRYQAEALAVAGVDFLIAQTLPAAPEAIGIAMAMAKQEIPYALSFIIQTNGTLLDNTPLQVVVDKIDNEVFPKPEFYMVNCVHPSVFNAAMTHISEQSTHLKNRVIGLQANTSSKRPEELEGLSYLDTEEPGTFADSLVELHRSLGTTILGGCCGTDHHHIEAIAQRLTSL